MTSHSASSCMDASRCSTTDTGRWGPGNRRFTPKRLPPLNTSSSCWRCDARKLWYTHQVYCTHVPMYAHVHSCMLCVASAHACSSVCMHKRVQMHICLCLHMHVCMCAHSMFVCTQVFMCGCSVHTCACMCGYAGVRVYTCVHLIFTPIQ
jgi:hypothetical protein